VPIKKGDLKKRRGGGKRDSLGASSLYLLSFSAIHEVRGEMGEGKGHRLESHSVLSLRVLIRSRRGKEGAGGERREKRREKPVPPVIIKFPSHSLSALNKEGKEEGTGGGKMHRATSLPLARLYLFCPAEMKRRSQRKRERAVRCAPALLQAIRPYACFCIIDGQQEL